MPAKLQISGDKDAKMIVEKIKELFVEIDETYSTFKMNSVVNKYRRGEITLSEHPELKLILNECEKTKRETNGFFDCEYRGRLDPSGLVKGYAISQGAKLLKLQGFDNFMLEIAGDLQTSGFNGQSQKWKIGIENPFAKNEIVKVVELSGQGMATSGTSVHKDHIIDPFTKLPAHEIASISVIADDIYDADRMATAAFAMGEKGIEFIHSLHGFAGYMITNDKQGIMTESFKQYVE